MRPARCQTNDHLLSRRQLLAGTIGGLGYSLCGQPLLSEALQSHRKRLLLIFLSGGASQLETWDPKPGTKYGGPFRGIPTSIPGVHISELLPHTAKIMHRLAVIRSINSGITSHFHGHYALQSGRTALGYPVLGSAAARLLEQARDVLPGYVSLRRDGPKAYTDVGDAGFLGPKYEGVKVVNCQPPDNLVRPDGLRDPLAALRDDVRRKADARFLRGRVEDPIHAYASTFSKADALMQQRHIFDLDREPARDRERYGKHDLGQNCLLARRLLEYGVSCVKVTHHDWDAHEENFHWHQQRCGEFDQLFATLVDDFAARGLLEDTLIVVSGEMGRTPRINHRYGRDHWGTAWSMAMTGCGIKPGVVFGKTNAEGTEVIEDEVDAGDLFHTYLAALGLDSTQNYEINGQTNPVADPASAVISAVLAS